VSVDERTTIVVSVPNPRVVSLLLTLQVKRHSQVNGTLVRQAGMCVASAGEDAEVKMARREPCLTHHAVRVTERGSSGQAVTNGEEQVDMSFNEQRDCRFTSGPSTDGPAVVARIFGKRHLRPTEACQCV
jgi:hypothetical protein